MAKYLLVGIAVVAVVVGAIVYSTRPPEQAAELNQKDLTEQLVTLMEQGDEAGATALLEQAAERNMNDAIDIKGRIEDEAGNPLTDVTVTFLQVHFAMDPTKAKSTSGEQVVDGIFTFSCADCMAIEAEFSKGGFHATRREWFAAQTNGVVDHAAVVVLQAQGKPAHLVNYTGQLETGAQTRVLAFSFDRRRTVMSPERVAKLAVSENVARPLFLELSAEREPDGSISVEQVSRPNGNVKITRPVNPFLDFGTANGGAISYEPTATNIRLLEREMSRAPTSGYLPTLDLTRLDGRLQYFYCRIGDRYGRGSVSPIGLSSSEDRPTLARAFVTIDLNAVAGDTNLTPRH